MIGRFIDSTTFLLIIVNSRTLDCFVYEKKKIIIVTSEYGYFQTRISDKNPTKKNLVFSKQREKKNTIQTIMSFRSFNTVLESVEYSALLDLTRFEKIKTLILTAKGNGLQNKR